ncbi:unnamed protein product [Symbiodinium natans]|uniref:Uncharacterized protein n=1 Tax=Symbiodinium natans TaxID=878477 RepID=A0A812JU44_9DINO|nr:unnamed protein product [Symbiodinium natans]
MTSAVAIVFVSIDPSLIVLDVLGAFHAKGDVALIGSRLTVRNASTGRMLPMLRLESVLRVLPCAATVALLVCRQMRENGTFLSHKHWPRRLGKFLPLEVPSKTPRPRQNCVALQHSLTVERCLAQGDYGRLRICERKISTASGKHPSKLASRLWLHPERLLRFLRTATRIWEASRLPHAAKNCHSEHLVVAARIARWTACQHEIAGRMVDDCLQTFVPCIFDYLTSRFLLLSSSIFLSRLLRPDFVVSRT